MGFPWLVQSGEYSVAEGSVVVPEGREPVPTGLSRSDRRGKSRFLILWGQECTLNLPLLMVSLYVSITGSDFFARVHVLEFSTVVELPSRLH
jgi:hypothetical protein